MRPKASWAGLICRTCLHLKRQILPHNGQLNVPADQGVKLETDLGRKGLEEKMSFNILTEVRILCIANEIFVFSILLE